MTIFGWSTEERRRVTELREAWAKVKASPAFVAPTFQHAYREDIATIEGLLTKIAKDEGALDDGDLTGAEISVRRVMWALFEQTKDAAFAEANRPQGGDLEAANPIASMIDREAKAATAAASSAVSSAATAIPTEYKVAGAVALVLVLLLALKL